LGADLVALKVSHPLRVLRRPSHLIIANSLAEVVNFLHDLDVVFNRLQLLLEETLLLFDRLDLKAIVQQSIQLHRVLAPARVVQCVAVAHVPRLQGRDPRIQVSIQMVLVSVGNRTAKG